MPGFSSFSGSSCTVAKLAVLAAALATLPASQTRLGDFENRLVAVHNAERAQKGVPAMEWDAGLARDAQSYADHLSRTGKFEHVSSFGDGEVQGENLWRGPANAYGPERMVRLWVEEKQHFKRGRFPHNAVTGNVADVSHFTQMIWRRTERVGCAVASDGMTEVLVCRYSQPGNVIGQRVL